MDSYEFTEAQLKLQAYQAAINACSSSRGYSMSMGGQSLPTVQEIKNEAERLWAWMNGNDKKAA